MSGKSIVVLRIRPAVMAVLAALALAGAACPAVAQTASSNAIGATATLHDQVPVIGEIVTPLNTYLDRFTFNLRAVIDASVTPEVYEWNGSTVVGPPVWTGAPVMIVGASKQTITFSVGAVVDPSKQYLLAIRQNDAGTTIIAEGGVADQHSGHYGYYTAAPINDWSYNPIAELNFSAVFSPSPVPVPTLSEWTMILLGLVLAGGAAVMIQRRRLTA